MKEALRWRILGTIMPRNGIAVGLGSGESKSGMECAFGNRKTI
jgi:hypothetical protein